MCGRGDKIVSSVDAGLDVRSGAGAPPGIGLSHLAYYLPAAALSVEEFGRLRGLSDAQTRTLRQAGLDRVYGAGEESPADLAGRAAERLLAAARIDPGTIDCVVLHHTSYLIPFEPNTVVAEVCRRLGLRNAIGLAVSGQYCASVLAALRVAHNMIASGSARRVMVLGADFFGGSWRREVWGLTVEGEAGSAALVEPGATRNRIVTIVNQMHGQFYRGVSAAARDTGEFATMYYLVALRVIREALRKAKATLADIRLIVPHNINRANWAPLLRHIGCDWDKLYSENIPRYGHLCGNDLMVNLADAAAEGRLRAGDLVLLVTVGLGGAWSAAVVRH
jgi:3-oxoacyl-[acyl-carrier-protein] synthase III